jgi:hypothetical protein
MLPQNLDSPSLISSSSSSSSGGDMKPDTEEGKPGEYRD